MAQELERNPLWLILVETAHALPLYTPHKVYVRNTLLIQAPGMTAEEISQHLDISLGEAMVIFHELKNEDGTLSEDSDERP
ncbi:hypothetical protein ISS40_09030 [Candidatus Bathyarchaeota archaeon]|nr:hypothetical protein [Candidatus Bathyarchaeota archaeon]MBL7168806.1 hypothetical protein [Candidatus Bathyarchaeota archaeon]